MGRRGGSAGLTNLIQERRIECGLSQQELADRAGFTRQAVNAIEGGRYTPNTVVAIRLAQALNCQVEALFRVPQVPIERDIARRKATYKTGDRVVVAEVAGTLVAHSVSGEHAASDGFSGADGVALSNSKIRLFVPPDEAKRTAILVGCDPSLAMLAARVTRRARNARLVWVPGASQRALDALRQTKAHIAGIHLRDPRTGECNIGEAKEALVSGGIVVGYADWEQGFVVRRGNPRSLGPIESLLQPGVRLVNREPGSGSRALLDQMLRDAHLKGNRISGYGRAVTSHMAIARAVADGVADVGFGIRAVANCMGLDFIPIVGVKFELLIPSQHLAHPAVSALLDVLQTAALRAELSALPGYEIGGTGTIRQQFEAVA